MREALCELVENAGKEVMAIYDREDLGVEYKADDSPLTLADRASNQVLVAGLKALTPDIPIISEESAIPEFEERKDWQRFWLVDPLDGTKEFIKRNGEFTVNIALIERHQPIIGVVGVPDRWLLRSRYQHQTTKLVIAITGSTQGIRHLGQSAKIIQF